jgi:prolyl oligopeptidase
MIALSKSRRLQTRLSKSGTVVPHSKTPPRSTSSRENPPGFGLRQSSGAFDRSEVQKAAEGCRTPKRYRVCHPLFLTTHSAFRTPHLRFRNLILLFLAIPFYCLAALADPSLMYPLTARTNQVDNYHGTLVADPYRWLEDDNSDATKAWVQAENKLTFGYLDKIPERPAIKSLLTKIWNYERFGVPSKEGGRYFLTRNDGLQNQSVLYTMPALSATPVLLLDPNTLSADGTVSLAGYAISHDGNLLAYGLARAGSDWENWRVRDVRTGKDLPDEIHWVKFSAASWTKDNAGFFYSRYDEPDKANLLKGVNYFHKLYYHRLGAPQSADTLIYQRPDHKDWNFNGGVTDDGRYLIIEVSEGTDTRTRIYYRDLEKPDGPVVELLNDFDAAYSFIDNVGTIFYFRTELNAPRGRVIAIDTAQPARANWKEIIPQSADRLEGVSLVNDQFIANYLKDARSEVRIFARDGKFVRNLELPGLGTADGFGGKRSDTETFYSFTSYTIPGTIYRYDLAAGTSSIFRQPKVAFNSGDYETKQIFYQSKDGARVPMFITAKKGLKLDGENPVYLYGYGGFDISITPTFSTTMAAWLEMGGVYCVATLRGGGEYGEEWHQAGMKLKKQNVFDDFIGAAEWLIAENHYTQPAKLVIGGRSNGGLLIGACLTQRPDLYGVGPAGGRCHGHAALSKIHHRLGVDFRLRVVGRPGRVQGALRVFAPAQHQARHKISRHFHHHRRPRRPRGPRAQF